MSTILFAHEVGITYVHTPLVEVDHVHRSESKAEAAIEWERLLPLGTGQLSSQDPAISQLPRRRVARLHTLRRTNDVLHVVDQCHAFADNLADRYLNIAPVLAKAFDSGSAHTYESHLADDAYNVAVHVRRGHNEATPLTDGRLTPIQKLAKTLDGLRTVFASTSTAYSIHVFSDGEHTEVQQLDRPDVRFHLDTNPQATFVDLACADLLVMAKSSFSYAAALLGDGVRLYEPFWHRPLNRWITVGSNGQFDKETLQARINEQLDRA